MMIVLLMPCEKRKVDAIYSLTIFSRLKYILDRKCENDYFHIVIC